VKTITMIKSTVCGGQSVKPGEVVEASDRDAFYLVATKAAKLEGDAPVEKKTRGRKPANRMVGEEELESRD